MDELETVLLTKGSTDLREPEANWIERKFGIKCFIIYRDLLPTSANQRLALNFAFSSASDSREYQLRRANDVGNLVRSN